MRNYNYDEDDESKDDIDRFFKGPDDDADNTDEVSSSGMIVDRNWLEHQERALASRIACNLMTKAKSISEKEWFWRFRSEEYKLKKIARVYFYLLEVITADTTPKEKEKEKKG